MNDRNGEQTLGILGGLGPMASVYFYEMLTAHTDAVCDQEHLNIILSSHAQTPDRSSFIMGNSGENPFDTMLCDAKKLETWGVDAIAIPCNTAHFFYDKLAEHCAVPIINIMEETAKHLAACGVKTAGVLATDGTIFTKTYDRYLNLHDIRAVAPDEAHQKLLMHIIFDEIKQGKRADMNAFRAIVSYMKDNGCERIILGCTELSLIKKEEGLSSDFVDSMEVLAKSIIERFGKTPVGFDF